MAQRKTKIRIADRYHSRGIYSIQFLLSLAICLFSAAAWSRADSNPLAELSRSEQMEEFNEKSTRLKAKSNYKVGDLDPRSNLAMALASRSRDRILLNWVEGGLVGFLRIKDGANRQPRFVMNEATYKDQQAQQKIFLKIYLPFPRYQLQAQTGFIEEIAALVPPALEVTSSEEVKIGKRTGTFYREKDGDCSLVFKLPGETLLSATSEKCQNEKRLKSFLHLLRLDRLEQKLTS